MIILLTIFISITTSIVFVGVAKIFEFVDERVKAFFIEGIQNLVNKMKEYNLDSRAGLMVCQGNMLRIIYMDEHLQKLLGNPKFVEDTLPAPLQAKHRELVTRFVGIGPLPDSLNHPLRNVPLQTCHDGIIQAKLIIGKFGSQIRFMSDLYYVVIQPSAHATPLVRNNSSKSLSSNGTERGGFSDEGNLFKEVSSLTGPKATNSSISDTSFFPDTMKIATPRRLDGSCERAPKPCANSLDEVTFESSSLHDEDFDTSALPSDNFQGLVEVYGLGAAAYIDRGLVPATQRYAQATVLYMDIVDFTRHCMAKPLDQISAWMTSIHAAIDALLERHAVRKVETRGDCVICVTGTNFVPEAAGASRDLCGDQASRMLSFGRDLGLALASIQGTQARMGMASGPVVLTHISHGGDTLPAKYIYGDTVNVACRMEQTGRVGAVQLEESAARAYAWERGETPPPLYWRQVKGKGDLRTAMFDYSNGGGYFVEEPGLKPAVDKIVTRSSSWPS